VVTPLDEVEAGYFSAVSYRFTVVNVTSARLLPTVSRKSAVTTL
jgi:hypothetical protein